MALDVTVLFFDGCPSWRAAVEGIRSAAAQTGVEVRVTTRQVETDQDAQRLGFTGSPTVLIDGRDPFARAGMIPALACRIYPTPEGPAGFPTVDQLAHALTQAAG